MGQSLFLENRGQCLVQVWLLMFCVLLCFRTGADAVKCRICSSQGPGKPCIPKGKTCEGPFCVMIETFSSQSGKLTNYIKGCGEDSVKRICGKVLTPGDKKKISCCDTNLCID